MKIHRKYGKKKELALDIPGKYFIRLQEFDKYGVLEFDEGDTTRLTLDRIEKLLTLAYNEGRKRS